jgi:formate dehydrogenase major subunit
VQGASDAGLIPMMYPDYRRVDNGAARVDFEALWGKALDPNPGLTVVEIMNAVHAGTIRGMYIMGENPAMSDPDVAHARAALAELEMLVVQDIFLTETGYLADVILPASAFPEKTGTFTNTDRLVQLGRQALTPPGEARQDLAIIVELAKCSPRCARRCRRSQASHGSVSSAKARSRTPASTKAILASASCSPTHFQRRRARASSFPRK